MKFVLASQGFITDEIAEDVSKLVGKPLNNINITQNMMNIMNYSGNTIPYGSLVYNHCSYRDSNGWFQESYGFENCVNADKILHPQASDENHY